MKREILCRPATPFTKSGALDEDGLRKFLQRFVDARVGVYMASSGSGEGHAMTNAELKRVYEITVEVCKGKVPTYANPPERNTAKGAIEQTMLAFDAGIELVNLYGPAGFHGYKPTDDELRTYFADVFAEVKQPIALAPNAVMGYQPKAELIAEICNKYPQVHHVNLSEQGEAFWFQIQDRLTRDDVKFCVLLPGSLHSLAQGAFGILSPEANILPKTYRRYLDLWETNKNSDELDEIYFQLRRFTQYVGKYNPSNPRWLKMCMRVLKLPGGEGGVREPYQLPPDDEIERFGKGLLKLNIPELNEQAQIAGLA